MPSPVYERVPSGEVGRNAAAAYPSRASWALWALLAGLSGVGVFLLLGRTLSAPPALPGTGGKLGGYPRGYRLAACYSGQAGTLGDVYKQNYEVLRAFDGEAEVLFVLDLQDNLTLKDGSRYARRHTMEELQPVFDWMQSESVETFSPQDVRRPPAGACDAGAAGQKGRYTQNLVDFWGMNQCYDLVKRREKEKKKKYDWILRLQPGMFIQVRRPPKDKPFRVHMSGAAAALVPRSMADAYFGLVDYFYKNKCEGLDAQSAETCQNYSYQQHTPECLIVRWLKQYDIVPSNGQYMNRRIKHPQLPS